MSTIKYSDGSAFHDVTPGMIGAIPEGLSIPSGTDLNTVVDSGSYTLQGSDSDFPNGPSAGGHGWSKMLVIHGSGDTMAQVIFPYNNTYVLVRTSNVPSGGDRNWKPWYVLSQSVVTSSAQPTDANCQIWIQP